MKVSGLFSSNFFFNPSTTEKKERNIIQKLPIGFIRHACKYFGLPKYKRTTDIH